ncbi:glycosyltransferase [Colwellia sp. BRX10-4]|uniref:glycosyltransferase n=1 Tax=Colwellia sp. BRX10-4 TaxID=2759843 RepID=UPI0015F43612|nr:glycosyltransferase [Colwellia sp. BRX10-4]MBA6396542.1 glycosyltransferase [Colwellia sp. BRX10-4]
MNKKKSLTIIIYSNLSIGGGGRETWLNNFVNSADILSYFEKITVVNALSVQEMGSKIIFPLTVQHKEIDVTAYGKIKRIIKFSRFCRRHLKEEINNPNHYVFCIGTFIDNIAASYGCFGSKCIKGTWIRGILEKELAQRRSGFMLSVIKLIEVFLLKISKIVISNGQDTADFYKLKGVDSTVINNGIYLDKFTQKQNGNPIVIGFIGRLNLEKGIDFFIDSLPSFIGVKNLKVIVAGDGSEKNHLIEAITKLKGQVEIQHLGVVDNDKIPALLATLDISIHLTGTGLLGGGGVSHSLIEAMASGNRIICWDNAIYNQVCGSSFFYKAKEDNLDSLNEVLKLAIETAAKENKPDTKMIESVKEYSFQHHVKSFLSLISQTITK